MGRLGHLDMGVLGNDAGLLGAMDVSPLVDIGILYCHDCPAQSAKTKEAIFDGDRPQALRPRALSVMLYRCRHLKPLTRGRKAKGVRVSNRWERRG